MTHAQNRRNDRGSALLVALVLTIILTSLVGGFIMMLNTSMSASNRAARMQVSMQLAEAGIDKAVAMLRSDIAYAGERDTPLGEGAFSVEVVRLETDRRVRVVSTASLAPNGAHVTRIEADISLTPLGPRIVAWKEGGQ
ncbi:MAG: hypothetical protein SGI88_19610 [Candidatus Hydrogenedentes bacterium]|nr:hypothetical protein [Candidatus Hydrogenedentota bacterium]